MSAYLTVWRFFDRLGVHAFHGWNAVAAVAVMTLALTGLAIAHRRS